MGKIRGHMSQGSFIKTRIKSDTRSPFPILARADPVLFCQIPPVPIFIFKKLL